MLVPAALEDAIRAHERGHLTSEQLDAHPEQVEYLRAVQSIGHGRAWRGDQSHGRTQDHLPPVEGAAFARLLKQRAADAQAARLAALSRLNAPAVPEPMPF